MLRGEARLVFRDVNTGEITRELEQKNTITDAFINDMIRPNYDTNSYYGGNGNASFGEYIFLGGLDQPTDRGWNLMYNVLDIGRTEAGIQNPSFLSGNVGTGGTSAYYYQYQQRFDPPAATRTIHTIGIGYYNETSVNNYYEPSYMCAYLALTTPCTQSPTETLDVFYRIIWDNPEQYTSDYAPTYLQMDSIARMHQHNISGSGFSDTWYPNTGYFYCHGKKHLLNSRFQYLSDGRRGYTDSNTTGDKPYATGYGDTGYRARILQTTVNLTQTLGRIIGSVGHAARASNVPDPESCRFFNAVIKDSDSPIQNIFSHASSAVKPFYDSSTVALGTGTLAIDGSNWTNPDFQKLLRVEVTDSGGVGGSPAGSYKIWQRPIVGFVNNTYQEDHVSIPFIHAYDNYNGIMFENSAEGGAGGMYGVSWIEHYGAMAIPYDATTFVGFNHYMVFTYDVVTNERHTWRYDYTTYTGNFSNISQVMADSDTGDIWVADASTGLHRFNPNGSPLAAEQFDNTHPDLSGIASSACYGVAKTPGRIWAIMHDSLIYTTDGGTTFTVYNSASTPAFNFAPAGQEYRYWFLQGDPSHADHRLAVGYNNDGNWTRYANLTIKWWSEIGGPGNTTPRLYYTATDTNAGYTNPQRRRETFQFFSCSPNDSVWGSRRLDDAYTADRYASGMWNFNATSPTHIYASTGYADSYREKLPLLWWSTDINGDDAMVMVDRWYWYGNRFKLAHQNGSLSQSADFNDTNPSGAVANWSNALFGPGAKVFLPDSGVFIATGGNSGSDRCWFMTCASDNSTANAGAFKNVIWKEYGWDGVNWVEGHAGSKPMHAASEPIIDGLAISFDDAAGAQTFVAGDYYTTGVIDGVLVDGGVEFDTRYAVYYKKVDFHRNEIEGGGVLPGSTSPAVIGLTEAEQTVTIDGLRVYYDDPSNRFYGTTTSQTWAARFYGSMTNRALFQGRPIDIDAGHYMVFGLANASKVGAPPTASDIDYAFRVTNVSNNNWRVEVLNNGVVVHTEYDPAGTLGNQAGEFNSYNDSWMYYRLYRPEGSTDLTLRVRNKDIYTFSGVTEALVPSVYSSTRYNYWYWSSMSTTYEDYHVDLGDSLAGVGKFAPNFFAIDYTPPGRPYKSDIKIDGVPVTTLLINDYGRTALASGEVELLTYQGKIRFSPADVGKTLTIDRYNVLMHE